MRRHKQIYTVGDYWTIHFDASPKLMQVVNGQMKQDPRVIRWTVSKLGERLRDIGAFKEATVVNKL